MRKKLTAKSIESFPPALARRYEVWDQTLPSFGVRISHTGRKTWFVSSRTCGRLKRHTIGTYPVLSLSDAREIARKIIGDIQRGTYETPAEKCGAPTLGETIPEFISRYARPKNRGWRETERILVKFSPLYNKCLDEVKRSDIVKVLDDIIASGAPFRANRALAAIKKLFAWSLDRGLIEINPIAGIRPPTKERSRDRVLSDGEIGRLWSASEELGYPFGPLLQLLLLTAQRRGEVAKMRWSHVDFERRIWTIPSEAAKNGRAHEVPLSDMVLDVFRGLPTFVRSDFVFTTTGRSPISGFGRMKRNLDAKMGVTGWRLHDLRRTAASGMARLGTAPHVIEKVLNHVSGTISGVAAVYIRHGFKEEKAEALLRWVSHLAHVASARSVEHHAPNPEAAALVIAS
jgi:integrase